LDIHCDGAPDFDNKGVRNMTPKINWLKILQELQNELASSVDNLLERH
jgi:hypothetical protein